MNKSTKAALLSALVFPGMGHFYLNKPVVGAFILGISFIPLYAVLTKAITQAQQIAEKIVSGDAQADMASIAEMLANQSTHADTQIMNMAVIVFIIIWLIAIADAYRHGRRQDTSQRSK